SAGQRLAVVLVEQRLGVEAVDLREPPVHEEEDDALGARGMIQLPRAERAILVCYICARDRFADEAGEREHAETVADAAERVAARHQVRRSVRERSAEASRSVS